MMKKTTRKLNFIKSAACVLLLLFYADCQAQIAGQLTVRTLSTTAIPHMVQNSTGNQFVFDVPELQTLFDGYNLLSFEQEYPAANNVNHYLAESLIRVYVISCDCNEAELKTDLENNASQFYDRIQYVPQFLPTCRYIPNDPNSDEPDPVGTNDYWRTWFLSMLHIYEAYCLLDGDSETILGITDVGYNMDHEDLASNIIITPDSPPNSPTGGHGTGVIGLASPVTNNGIGIAGAGNNCPMQLYQTGYNSILQATINGALVVNCSWFAGFTIPGTNDVDCSPFNQDHQDIVTMVRDLGTVVVAASSNGNYGSSCFDDEHGFVFPASYDDVISVSSLDRNQRFTVVADDQWCGAGDPIGDNQLLEVWSTHNDMVDVVAPSHCAYTTHDDGYGWAWHGTSFSAPLVTAICGLILDANPSLTPAEVEAILKSTAEDVSGIEDNASYYPNSPVPELPNAYRAVLAAKNMTEVSNLDVLEDDEWSSPRYLKDDLHIYDGATLTLTSEVLICPNVRIVVHQGGKLRLDGAYLHSNNPCGRWQGITVLGNPDQSQYGHPDHKQGHVTIFNNSTVENAIEAISLYDIDDPENTTGGSVSASNSSFINNERTVNFKAYQNFYPFTLPEGWFGQPKPNGSSFTNCTFEINSEFSGDSFLEHALLQEVDGIRFRACHFINENYDPLYSYRIGIHAIDAHFDVGGICTTTIPCTNWDRSSFSGLGIGIKVTMSGCFLYTYKVDRSDFFNNYIGIYSSAVNAPVITRSNFEVGLNSLSTSQAMGIFFDGGTGFTIEENIFEDDGNSISETIGLLIRETGEANNEIRKNEYAGLHIANLSNGDNRDGNEVLNGLHYYCNENTHNTFDFSVPYEEFNPDTEYGIAQNQGAFSEAAGNKFSQNANNPESDFQNTSPWTINYFYYLQEAAEEPLSYSAFLNPIEILAENTCEVHYPKSIKSNSGDKPALQTIFWDEIQERDNLKQTWINQIDGGNTNALLEQIINSTIADSSQLTADLLNLSPWLSKRVLESAADRTDVLDHATMYDILLANLDESKNQRLLNYLATKSDPMPSNMIANIANTAFVPTSRTNLESDLSFHSVRLSSAASKLSHYFLTDTLAHSQDSVRLWLSRQESLESGMAIVDSWLHEGNTTGATLALNDIPQTYDLSIKQQLEYNYFFTLKNIQIELQKNGQCVYDLDSLGLVPIVDLAENSRGIAGLQAKNILNTGFAYNYYDEPILPEIQNQNRIGNYGRIQENQNSVYAFPNPASEMVQFHYQVKRKYPKMNLRIWDNAGTLVDELTIKENNEGFLSWDTRQVETGFYFYSICTNKQVLASGKLVVTR